LIFPFFPVKTRKRSIFTRTLLVYLPMPEDPKDVPLFDKSFYNKMLARLVHEINNPLMVISNYISLLIEDIDQVPQGSPLQLTRESEHYDSLHEIAEQCQRISKITKNLQKFSRTSSSPPKNYDLQRVISGVISDLEPMIVKSQIQLRWEAPEDPCGCLIRYEEIEQVIQALLRNAIYALNQKYHGKRSPQKNTIYIRMYQETRDQEGTPKQFVVVAIRDDGIGIQKEDREHIFEPFFSTKKTKMDVPEFDKAQGLGLGLSYCRTIMAQHEGYISFESEMNTFTEFLISLPCSIQNDVESDEEDDVVF